MYSIVDMKPTALILFLLAMANLVFAQAKPTVEAKLNYDGLQPGGQAAVAVVVTIPDQLHSQSNRPTDERYVPFLITPTANATLKTLPVVYPRGEDVTYPSLGKLNVYTGQVIAYIPLEVAQDAREGALEISGKLQIQLCNDQACFKPFRGNSAIPFSIQAQIVPKTRMIAPANADLFAGFDPRVFASATTATAATSATPVTPATPATSATSAAGTDIQLFGWSFSLGHGAYGLAFAVAFVVGIIFNLMPCVLPVVPLKAIGFYEASQHSRIRCFALGVVFSLGMLAVFAILASLIIVGGAAWGELFAKGWFVWSIVIVLTVMAFGQLGGFAVVLPNAVYSYVPTHSSWLGNFLFGGFTAILSTPCTAPMFVGLLAWASAQSQAVGVATIMMVGLGMAFPYLLLASIPELARKVPRTGAWSELLKQFMAFLLLAVAAWFAAGRLLPGNAYLWIVLIIVTIGCAFLIVRTKMIARTPKALAVASLVSAVILGAMLWFTLKLTGSSHELIAWQPYSEAAFEKARSDGRLVMLEFTANWCANCKELESRVFTNQRTADSLRTMNVIPMRADLTLDDAPGWDKLRTLSKSGGIPLTVIYSPTLKMPVQLSSIYTVDNLVAALQTAGQKN